jgi:hypothetical protein
MDNGDEISKNSRSPKVSLDLGSLIMGWPIDFFTKDIGQPKRPIGIGAVIHIPRQ